MQGLNLTAQLHGSSAAVRRVFDEQTTAAGLTGLVHKWALPDTPHFGGLSAASLPALQAQLSTTPAVLQIHRVHRTCVPISIKCILLHLISF